MNAVLNELPRLVEKELEAANVMHTLFHSFHEGYAVTLAEVDEVRDRFDEMERIMGDLWSDVKHDNTSRARLYAQALEDVAVLLAAEAIQVAAMARKMQAIEPGWTPGTEGTEPYADQRGNTGANAPRR